MSSVKMSVPLALAGVAAGAVVSATAALAAENPLVTTESALVDEFTATWCGPCVGAYYALERLKERWGDQVSILTYSVADELDNGYNSRRESEEGIWALPTFVFQGNWQQLGTPPDNTLDNYVQLALDTPRAARVIARYKFDTDDRIIVGMKIDALTNVINNDNVELRLVVHESNWEWNCSNGLDMYQHHVQGGYDVSFPHDLQPGHPEIYVWEIDMSGNGYLRNWDEVGVTAYLYDTVTRTATASWELGQANLGDLDGNLMINRRDGALFRDQVGKTNLDPDFNPAADWDKNGVIDLTDRDLFLDYVQNGGLR